MKRIKDKILKVFFSDTWLGAILWFGRRSGDGSLCSFGSSYIRGSESRRCRYTRTSERGFDDELIGIPANVKWTMMR